MLRKIQFLFVSTLLLTEGAVTQAQSLSEPIRDSGNSVTAAFEGWFQNPDGTFSILLGYMNRNQKEELDVPIGPNNRIEPGGPDMGQPTHFFPRRGWGVFTITVPNDFGAKKLTWTLTANGTTTAVPVSLNTLWEIAPFKDATENTPPYIGFSEKGPFVSGPKGQSTALNAVAGVPVTIPVWVSDDAHVSPGAPKIPLPAVSVVWSKFRGPGTVTLSKDRPAVVPSVLSAAPASGKFQGKAETTATFAEPGEYVLKVTANDWSGEGGRGFQCCWSNAQVKVSVKAGGAN